MSPAQGEVLSQGHQSQENKNTLITSTSQDADYIAFSRSLVVSCDGSIDIAEVMNVPREKIRRIAFDSQTDSRELIGVWTCVGDGKFQWRAGLLHQALSEGVCLIVEGLEHCGDDVIAKLTQVAKWGSLETDFRQTEYARAHPDFLLILAHISNNSFDEIHEVRSHKWFKSGIVDCLDAKPTSLINLPIWRHIEHWPRVILPSQPITSIIEKTISPKLLSIVEDVVKNFLPSLHELLKTISFGRVPVPTAPMRTIPGTLVRRLPSLEELRFLLTTLQRASERSPNFDALRHWPNKPNIPEQQRLNFGRILMSCFCSSLPEVVRSCIIEELLYDFLGFAPCIPQESAFKKLLLYSGIPLDRSTYKFNGSILSQTPDLAENKVQEAVAQTCLQCADLGKPFVLVGSPGGGKTQLIKALAKLKGQQLLIFSCHDQAEPGDLIGEQRPVYVEALLTELLEKLISRVQNNLTSREIQHLRSVELSSRKDQLVLHCSQLMGLLPPDELPDWKNELNEALKVKSVVNRFQDGVLLKALREGHWLLLDEVNMIPADVLARLLPLLNGAQNYLVHENGGQLIQRHPNFQICGTMNPPCSADPTGQCLSTLSVAAQKKELAMSLRSKFIEIYVDEINDLDDIVSVIRKGPCTALVRHANLIAEAYVALRETIHAGSINIEQRQFSLRTLSRILDYTKSRVLEFQRANTPNTCALKVLVEAMILFSGSTRQETDQVILKMLEKYFPSQCAQVLSEEENALKIKPYDPATERFQDYVINLQPSLIPCASGMESKDNEGHTHVLIDRTFRIPLGNFPHPDLKTIRKQFLVPTSVKVTLRRLLRLIQGTKAPILLEGATSVGKTSVVEYIANITANQIIRINNHEQITLAEYLGCYVPDTQGTFTFQRGPLLNAVINGAWVVLDEFNLAPQEVLEGLNRLLDDSREVFVAELNQTFVAHENFRLFATQNPVSYGGRKALTEAMQSRFVQLFVPEPDAVAASQILMGRCPNLAPRSAEAMIKVYEKCRVRRLDDSQVFDILITMRDLLRWAKFIPDTDDEMVASGLMVIGERLRSESARMHFFNDVLRAVLPRSNALMDDSQRYTISRENYYTEQLGLSMTKPMRRLLSVVQWSWQENEPLILIGVTGSGKTAVIDAVASQMSMDRCGNAERFGLISINCQQNTEVDDFIGCFKPNVLKPSATLEVLKSLESFIKLLKLNEAINSETLMAELQNIFISARADSELVGRVHMKAIQDALENWFITEPSAENDESQNTDSKRSLKSHSHELSEAYENLITAVRLHSRVFTWQDGPLVRAMLEGHPFLIDEINLADDAVIERLNSVLESGRFLRVNDRPEPIITAHPDFRIFATMNPGGDYGKRELSKAIKNRFFEVYVGGINVGDEDCKHIIGDRLTSLLKDVSCSTSIIERLNVLTTELFKFIGIICLNMISIRDLITFLEALSKILIKCYNSDQQIDTKLYEAILHALFCTVLDGFEIQYRFTAPAPDYELRFGEPAGPSPSTPQEHICLYAIDLCAQDAEKHLDNIRAAKCYSELCEKFYPDGTGWVAERPEFRTDAVELTPFILKAESVAKKHIDDLTLASRTTLVNLAKLMRAMNSPLPVLLEGAPGVGKTALILYLARILNKKIYRFNLNEQTDVSELLGLFAPEGKSFVWKAGGLTQAMLDGDWVLLDEINLAPQPVLEGLNSLLDYRKSIYIPDVDQTIKPSEGFRMFAAQNSVDGGGGRKGLPQSFLNRFAKISVQTLTYEDQLAVLKSLSHKHQTHNPPTAETDEWSNIVTKTLQKLSTTPFQHPLARTWEWNARDLQRIIKIGSWLHRSVMDPESKQLIPQNTWRTAFDLVFKSKFDSKEDVELYEKCLEPLLKWTPKIACDFKAAASFTHSQRTAVVPLIAGIMSNTPILLSGPHRIGKTYMIKKACATLKLPLHFMHLSPTSDGSEILGAYISDPDAGLRWAPSMLCKVVQSGGVLVMTGMEHAEAGVLDRLNALMETNGYLTLSDSGEFQIIHPHPNFRLILVGSSQILTNLSPAVRNRCLEICLHNETGLFDAKDSDLDLACFNSLLNTDLAEAESDLTGIAQLTAKAVCEKMGLKIKTDQIDFPLKSALWRWIRTPSQIRQGLYWLTLNLTLLLLQRNTSSERAEEFGPSYLSESAVRRASWNERIQGSKSPKIDEEMLKILKQVFDRKYEAIKSSTLATAAAYAEAICHTTSRNHFAKYVLELSRREGQSDTSDESLRAIAAAENEVYELSNSINKAIHRSHLSISSVLDPGLLRRRQIARFSAINNPASGYWIVNAILKAQVPLPEHIVSLAQILDVDVLDRELESVILKQVQNLVKSPAESSLDSSRVNDLLRKHIDLFDGLAEIAIVNRDPDVNNIAILGAHQEWLQMFCLCHGLDPNNKSLIQLCRDSPDLDLDNSHQDSESLIRLVVLNWLIACRRGSASIYGRTDFSTWADLANTHPLQDRFKIWLRNSLGDYSKERLNQTRSKLGKVIAGEPDRAAALLKQLTDSKTPLNAAPPSMVDTSISEIIRLKQELESQDIKTLSAQDIDPICLMDYVHDTTILRKVLLIADDLKSGNELEAAANLGQAKSLEQPIDHLSGVACHYSLIDPTTLNHLM